MPGCDYASRQIDSQTDKVTILVQSDAVKLDQTCTRETGTMKDGAENLKLTNQREQPILWHDSNTSVSLG